MSGPRVAAAAAAAALATASRVKPYALRLKEAAAYCGYRGSTFRALMTEGRKRIAAGLEPLGPRWHVRAGGTVFFLVSDLEEWLQRTSVPFGTCANRGK